MASSASSSDRFRYATLSPLSPRRLTGCNSLIRFDWFSAYAQARWRTRSADERIAAAVPYRLLQEVPQHSYGDQHTENMLIQGDNLEALKALLPFYAGRVKCIFIVPPYNAETAPPLDLSSLGRRGNRRICSSRSDNEGAGIRVTHKNAPPCPSPSLWAPASVEYGTQVMLCLDRAVRQ